MAAKSVYARFNKLYRNHKPASDKADLLNKYRFIRYVDREYLGGKSEKVLDVGFGDGDLIKLLHRNYRTAGLDINRENVESARKLYPGSEFFKASMLDFRLEQKYDMITCICAIDHGDLLRKHMGKTIRNLGRHLNSNGALIFDLNFTKYAWPLNKMHVYEGSELGEKGSTYAIISFREMKRGRNLSFSAYLRVRGSRIEHEIMGISETPFLLTIKGIRSIAAKSGFRCYVYDDWTGKKPVNRECRVPVFVLVRK